MAENNDKALDLRRLKRRDLVEIIYEMKRREIELTEELEKTKADAARFKERLREKDQEIENHWMKLEELMMKIQEGMGEASSL